MSVPLTDLFQFLQDNCLLHLYEGLLEHGIELEQLLLANESDLRDIATKLVDRITLRHAIELWHKKNQGEIKQSLQPQQPEPTLEKDTNAPENITISSKSQSSVVQPQVISIVETSSDCIEWEFINKNFDIAEKRTLQSVLLLTTYGKDLLKLQGGVLTRRYRKILVQTIVEYQLQLLPNLNDTIRQEVWTNWAKEICKLFPGEQEGIYYIPYTVANGKVYPASGLLHNRLITHRRGLQSTSRSRQSSSGSESSGGKRSSASSSEGTKRFRSLPLEFIPVEASDDDNPYQSIDWLKSSSSPRDILLRKWQSTFQLRTDILKAQSTVEEYFNIFPALKLPHGHELLLNDFDNIYPNASAVFEENFPLIKFSLLKQLADKGSDPRADKAIVDILDLATVGEQQGNLAALRSIPYLLKQVGPISTGKKGKKGWKPARSEVSQAFITFVSSPTDIERCINDRVKFVHEKGLHFGPFIIAVGPCWPAVTQYEVVVFKNVRYQFPDIKSAIAAAIRICFALDIEYASDAVPCWIFIQRAIYKIETKQDSYYSRSVPLRELIQDCTTYSKSHTHT